MQIPAVVEPDCSVVDIVDVNRGATVLEYIGTYNANVGAKPGIWCLRQVHLGPHRNSVVGVDG